MRSRTSSPVMPLVVATKLMASRSQQSRAKATRTRSPLSQPISRPSEAGVARVHGDAPLVPALLAAGVALEQEPMHLHDAVDPLHVRGGPALPLGLATQESMNPSIAVGGQIGDERLDRGEKPRIRQRRATIGQSPTYEVKQPCL